MSVNQNILDLIDEEMDPCEIELENTIEDIIELEEDAIFGNAEDDDDVIDFIDGGNKLGYEDPVDFSDDVEDVIHDDMCD